MLDQSIDNSSLLVVFLLKMDELFSLALSSQIAGLLASFNDTESLFAVRPKELNNR